MEIVPVCRPPSSGRKAARRGFTLIELMVVIVILGLLIGLVGKNVWNALFGATRDTATTQMKLISGAIEMYRANKRTIPRSLDELTQPDERTQEPYMEKIPLDPWSQPFEYKVLDERKGKYEIISGGEDKTIGTEDDLYEPPHDTGR